MISTSQFTMQSLRDPQIVIPKIVSYSIASLSPQKVRNQNPKTSLSKMPNRREDDKDKEGPIITLQTRGCVCEGSTHVKGSVLPYVHCLHFPN